MGTLPLAMMSGKATGSKVVEVNASHVAMISKPGATVELIERAVRATR